MERQPKTDCFGFCGPRNKRCSVLIELVCKKRECTFYKTREQYESDRFKYEKIVAAKKLER